MRGSRASGIFRAVRPSGVRGQRPLQAVSVYTLALLVFPMVEGEKGRGALLGGSSPARRLPAHPRTGSRLPNFAPLEPFIVLPVGSWSLILLSLAPERCFLSLHRYFLCIFCLKTAACCRFLLRAAVPSANSWHFLAAPGKTGVRGAAYRRRGTRVAPPKAAHAPAKGEGLRRQSYNAPFLHLFEKMIPLSM